MDNPDSDAAASPHKGPQHEQLPYARRPFTRPPFTESASATKSSTQTGWWWDYVAGNPLEAARDLDDWVLRHADGDGDGDLGTTPVSGGLT